MIFFMGPDKQRRLTLECQKKKKKKNWTEQSGHLSVTLFFIDPPPPDWPKENGSLYTIKSADRGLTFE